jgi:hypothetical protein
LTFEPSIAVSGQMKKLSIERRRMDVETTAALRANVVVEQHFLFESSQKLHSSVGCVGRMFNV